MGRTTTNPIKHGTAPSNKATTTSSPHNPSGTGLRRTAMTDVAIAEPPPAGWSSGKGNDPTLTAGAPTAKIAPTIHPKPIIAQPAGVVNRSCMNRHAETGDAGPK